MSNIAQIDQNEKPTWLVYNETTGLVETVYVDPITNSLYVFNMGASAGAVTTLNTAKIDANDKPTELGYNESSSLPEALRCTNSGVLLIDPI